MLKLDHLYYKNDSLYAKMASGSDTYLIKSPSIEVIN